MSRTRRSRCPVSMALEVIGDRWSLLVLRDVMFGNRRHFRVLQDAPKRASVTNGYLLMRNPVLSFRIDMSARHR